MREHSAVAATALVDRDDRRLAQQRIAGSATSQRSIRGWASLATRLIGAIAVVIFGVVHLQAYGGPYAAVPTIGELFLLNFVAALAIGAALLLPLEHVPRRWATAGVVLVTIAGIGLAAVSLVMLVFAEQGTLFGFHEPGYDPEAISRSRRAEIAAIGLLTASLALRWPATARPRW